MLQEITDLKGSSMAALSLTSFGDLFDCKLTSHDWDSQTRKEVTNFCSGICNLLEIWKFDYNSFKVHYTDFQLAIIVDSWQSSMYLSSFSIYFSFHFGRTLYFSMHLLMHFAYDLCFSFYCSSEYYSTKIYCLFYNWNSQQFDPHAANSPRFRVL